MDSGVSWIVKNDFVVVIELTLSSMTWELCVYIFHLGHRGCIFTFTSTYNGLASVY